VLADILAGDIDEERLEAVTFPIEFMGKKVRAGTADGKHSETPGLASPQRCHADPPNRKQPRRD
jgi:hypothetical protein